MSAIWDKITGKEEAHPQDQTQAPLHKDAHPPPVVTEATTQTVPHKQEESSFSFAKMKDALVGPSAGAKQPAPVPVTEPTRDKDSWHEKLKDLLDFGISNKHDAEEEKLKLEREAAEKEVAAKEAEEKASVKGKLRGLFKSDEEEAAEHKRLVELAIQKRREAELAKRNEHSFAAKVKDVFDDDSEEKEKERQRLAEEAKKNESFGARIRNIFDYHPTPPPAPETHHLFSHAPPPPPEPKDWKDKLSELTGLGAKPEVKEGHLDKAIDFYQEHVLREGPQTHESAFERAKDHEIASAIRHATGHKDDKHH